MFCICVCYLQLKMTFSEIVFVSCSPKLCSRNFVRVLFALFVENLSLNQDQSKEHTHVTDVRLKFHSHYSHLFLVLIYRFLEL